MPAGSKNNLLTDDEQTLMIVTDTFAFTTLEEMAT